MAHPHHSDTKASMAKLRPYMNSVNAYRHTLQRLQDAWEQLTLLGQMSGIAADITATAKEFRALTDALLQSLASRLLHQVTDTLRAKAQVSIDILVRNLFERTADVGFLATDTPVRDFLLAGGEDPQQRADLEARFRAYVAKYSVYDDVVVLDTQGRVRARLDGEVQAQQSRHAFWQTALTGPQAYVEVFAPLDVLDGRQALVYAAPINDEDGRALGVLCLSFKLDDEMRGVFAKLAAAEPAHVLTLLNSTGQVVASSDAWQVPVGAPLAVDMGATGPQQLNFAGRDYLAVVAHTSGYQGYGGPGWTGCALVPLSLAFGRLVQATSTGDDAPPADDAAHLAPMSEGCALFDDTLRRIPLQARHIQLGLARSVWNGELHGRRASDASASESRFAAALLHQVGVTGERIRNVFEQAIADLQRSASGSVLEEARFRAALAIDIMDRNLYERANDCRWWALDGTLRQTLREPGPDSARKAAQVLAHINSLYTVYDSLLLLDAQGQIVATSRAASAQLVGQRLSAPWVREALGLPDAQRHARSAFDATALYGERHTYVYAAPVQAGTGQTVGATAIVFDSQPQFEAMLRDALPQPGATLRGIGLYVSRDGQVIASTDPRYLPGQRLPFHAQLPDLARGASCHRFLDIDGELHALGMTMSAGYREYNAGGATSEGDVAALVLISLGCPAVQGSALGHLAGATAPELPAPGPWPAGRSGARQGLAAFMSAGQWLALDAGVVLEALDSPRLTALPGSHGHVAGVMLHGGRMVPVIDLARLRGHPPTLQGEARSSPALVLICQTSEAQAIGIMVDQLAGVFDVPRELLGPLPEGLRSFDTLAQSILHADGHGHMLTVLSLDHIAACVWGRTNPADAADMQNLAKPRKSVATDLPA